MSVKIKMKTQSEIRLKILKVRNALNKAEVINASKIIEQNFLSLSEIKDKTNYFVYNSFIVRLDRRMM